MTCNSLLSAFFFYLQALGNFYFIHESLTDVLIYNFGTKSFDEVDGIKVYAKDIEEEPTKEKSKFPLEYFPEVGMGVFFLVSYSRQFDLFLVQMVAERILEDSLEYRRHRV